LYLSVFEQPASRVFFSILRVNGWSAVFDELVKNSEIVSNVIPAEAGIQCNEALKTKKASPNSSWDAFLALPSYLGVLHDQSPAC